MLIWFWWEPCLKWISKHEDINFPWIIEVLWKLDRRREKSNSMMFESKFTSHCKQTNHDVWKKKKGIFTLEEKSVQNWKNE